jgi:hypothetical protein
MHIAVYCTFDFGSGTKNEYKGPQVLPFNMYVQLKRKKNIPLEPNIKGRLSEITLQHCRY